MLLIADSLFPIYSDLVHALAKRGVFVSLQEAAHHALFIAADEGNPPLRSEITAAIIIVMLGAFLAEHAVGE